MDFDVEKYLHQLAADTETSQTAKDTINYIFRILYTLGEVMNEFGGQISDIQKALNDPNAFKHR